MVPEPEQLFKLILKSNKFPSNLRLLFVYKGDFIRIYKKRIILKFHYSDITGPIKNLKCDRGQILDIFGKLEFFINEIILLKILGPNSNNVEMLENILEYVDLFSRVRLLSDWEIFDNKLKEALMQTKQVRNGLAHRWDEKEVYYKGKMLKDNLSKLIEDLLYIWKEIITVYVTQQDKIDIRKIIKEIEELNK